jgi:hypothetical protein
MIEAPVMRLEASLARNAIACLRPPPHQHQIRRTRRQQGDGECDVHSLAGGFAGRSHDDENIGRFYPKSLGRYFSPDSGLVYDSARALKSSSLDAYSEAIALCFVSALKRT